MLLPPSLFIAAAAWHVGVGQQPEPRNIIHSAGFWSLPISICCAARACVLVVACPVGEAEEAPQLLVAEGASRIKGRDDVMSLVLTVLQCVLGANIWCTSMGVLRFGFGIADDLGPVLADFAGKDVGAGRAVAVCFRTSPPPSPINESSRRSSAARI
ncbi:unnamed protein product [Gongylonema pulchrum]|uniref:Aa_trans domain-containing protein n=1 Tax=Gongylonema pulchrum TaxID=637853 RepID=A0A183DR90_9BILA|nr:unnamed protein product [Gongylonema pulchrum]